MLSTIPRCGRRTGILVCLAILSCAVTVPPASADEPVVLTNITPREPIYPDAANAEEDVARALARAKRDNKRVLLQYGGNSCKPCYRLHDLFTKNEEISSLLNAEYELVLVSDFQIAKRFDTQVDGTPFLTVLDAHGKKLVDQQTGSFRLGKYHDPDKVLAFLNRWKNTPLNNERILFDAKAPAQQDKLRIIFNCSVLEIKPEANGEYRALVVTRMSRKWYGEGDSFEAYSLLNIDPDKGTCTIYSEYTKQSHLVYLESP